MAIGLGSTNPFSTVEREREWKGSETDQVSQRVPLITHALQLRCEGVGAALNNGHTLGHFRYQLTCPYNAGGKRRRRGGGRGWTGRIWG